MKRSKKSKAKLAARIKAAVNAHMTGGAGDKYRTPGSQNLRKN